MSNFLWVQFLIIAEEIANCSNETSEFSSCLSGTKECHARPLVTVIIIENPVSFIAAVTDTAYHTLFAWS